MYQVPTNLYTFAVAYYGVCRVDKKSSADQSSTIKYYSDAALPH